MLTQQQIKEAGILKRQLENGKIDVNLIKAFLVQIESTKPIRKPSSRFEFQLENLNRGTSKKAKKSHQL